jgi:hypothetical protein
MAETLNPVSKPKISKFQPQSLGHNLSTHLDWDDLGAALLQPPHVVIQKATLLVILGAIPWRCQNPDDGRPGKVAMLGLEAAFVENEIVFRILLR